MVTRRRKVPRERLVGDGRLLDRSGNSLTAVRYDLQFHQELLRADTLSGSSELEGHRGGGGELQVLDDPNALLNVSEAILKLEDGQRIDVFFRHNSIPGERVVRFDTSGDLEPA